INTIMRDADAFMKSQRFYLPPFAYWTPADWSTKGTEVSEIVERALGWDITDFGQGDYRKIGLFIFTIRNGTLDALRAGRGKMYCEKILVVDVDQVTPMHFHWIKVEDIINRGGGELVIQMYNSRPDDGLDSSDVLVSLDGVRRVLPAGAKAVPLDSAGQVAAVATTEYPLLTPRPGWTEQDPTTWWEAAVTSIRRVLNEVRVREHHIAAVGLTGQMHGLVPLDGGGSVLRPAILWNDQRTAEECA